MTHRKAAKAKASRCLAPPGKSSPLRYQPEPGSNEGGMDNEGGMAMVVEWANEEGHSVRERHPAAPRRWAASVANGGQSFEFETSDRHW